MVANIRSIYRTVSNLACRGVIVASWVAMTVAVSGCGGGSDAAQTGHREANGNEAKEDAIAVKVEPLRRDTITSVYSTSATLRADRRATVIARTRGVIERLAVEEGDLVEAGKVMAELENDEQRIAAARARTSSETARREVERLAGLLERGLVSEDEFEKSKRDADDARHALDLAELELSRTTIRAPFAGIVLQRHLDVGATVADGTAVYDLADVEPIYADINIPERHVTELSPDQRVQLTADATGDSVAASIERIAPLVDPATGTVKVTVAVEGASTLRPGAFVRVDIVTDTHDEVLVVRRSALVAEGRRWHLFRLKQGEQGATAEQVEVAIGFENGDKVEIARVVDEAIELAVGTPVVVVGAPALSDGAAVEVVEEESTTPTADEA